MIVSAIQVNSGDNIKQNWNTASKLVRQAAESGAKFVALPENFLYIGQDNSIEFDVYGEWKEKLSSLASDSGIYLVAGTVREKTDVKSKFYNTCLFFGPNGDLLSVYRKIHLFDVSLPDGNEYSESSYTLEGENEAIARTPFGTVGFAICYDLRFPELFRCLTIDHGVSIIVLPSEFTALTGPDHWLPLIRARAIENQVFFIAPNQFGAKFGKRIGYGHSVIVDPWGTVISEAENEESIIYAELDINLLNQVRQSLPCLDHARFHKKIKKR
ncbi:MAG: carbon-nitrogen hydrolase family protein [Candidatus Theseobacter exili]|nr:carbon-nitrogen hydrolase family protein [Candidatus Theseobacter exili]